LMELFGHKGLCQREDVAYAFANHLWPMPIYRICLSVHSLLFDVLK